MSLPLLLSHDSNGGVEISINSTRYTYVIPRDKVEYVRELFKHTPWKGVNWLKLNFKYYKKEN